MGSTGLSTVLGPGPQERHSDTFARWERLLEYMVVAVLKGRSDEVQDPALIQMQQKMQLLNAWLDTRSITGTPRVVNRGY